VIHRRTALNHLLSEQPLAAKPLEGKVALVTGASSGIGAATASALGAAGAAVVAHYRQNADGARAATAALRKSRKLLVRADFAYPRDVDELWFRSVAWRRRVDVLVNNAAIVEPTPWTLDDAGWTAQWKRQLDINVVAPVTLVRRALQHFRQRGAGGVIITLSSVVAHRGPAEPSLVAYAASKSAIANVTRTLAYHHAKDGILGYVIAPGLVATPASDAAAERAGGYEALLTGLPLQEPVPAGEVADLVVFLANGTARHLTGAILDVNGAAYVR